ncbi:MAG: hypothetical protein QME66_13580 [Candidatus Eisenbacteria bacterium]|nr:hypothetical protein [Candidatus Eisenbacteria bacterium]
MNTETTWTKGLFALAGAFLLCSQPVLAQTSLDRETTTGRVGSLVVAAEGLLGEKGTAVDPMEAVRVARGLLYRVRAIESDDSLGPHPTHPLLEFGKQSSPDSRRACAMNILGTNLYSEIEKRFLKSLETSTNALERIAAFQVLSKGIASSNAAGVIARDLNSNLRRPEDESMTNQPQMSAEMFWAAESLCYLGQTNGLRIMSWALDSKKTSPAEKVVAIEALVTLHTKEARETLLQSAQNLATSTNPSVARDAFDALHRVPEFREIGTRAGEKQLERLKSLCEKAELNRDDWALLSEVSFYFRRLQEKGLLSLDDQRKVKRTVIDMLRMGRKEGSLSLANVFGMLASDEDAEVIKDLLKSKWADVRRQAIWSVLKCSPEVRMKLVQDVMPLLDDQDSQNRRAALDVIRVAKGEKPREVAHWDVRSQEEFKTEANRIKTWWNAEKK